MKIQLIRTNFEKEYTEGRLFIERASPQASPAGRELANPDHSEEGAEDTTEWTYYCDTLERGYDPLLSLIKGSCKCVAPGTYKVVTAWSPRFKRLMPYLCDVPGRSGVMIHPGNTKADSTGCILLGTRTQPGFVARSRVAFDGLYSRIEAAYRLGEEVTIEIV